MDTDLVAMMELLRGDCYAPTNGYDGLGTAGGPEDRAAAWHAVAELLALRLERCQGNYIELWDGCYSDDPPEHDVAPERDAVANVVLVAIRG